MRRHPQQVRQGHGHYLPPSQLPGHGVGPAHHHGQHPHDPHAQAQHPPPQVAAAALAAPPPPGAASHLTSTTFASLPLSAASQRALVEVLRFTHLTEVQDATLPAVRRDFIRRLSAGIAACRLVGRTVLRAIPPLSIRQGNCQRSGPCVWRYRNACCWRLRRGPPGTPQILAGGDVMARAKTGTGKTMGFLIPSVEALVRRERRKGDMLARA